MITRPFWLKKIKSAWKSRSIVWLSGVRRVGKTTLTKMLKPDIYLNCDLPSTQRLLEDPEFYLSNLDSNSVIVFDEIHRLGNPSQLLKIAADEFPSLKIIATGSSTLAATKKFRDSLTGRKAMIHLTPVLWTETNEQFKINDLTERLLRG
ncbi:MAG TPA: ATPase, partial [Caldithrix abyssi]|nr:ATPase [Caldithrix abyssi]